MNMHRMQGFVYFDYIPEFSEGREQLSKWMGEDKIKPFTTLVKGGIVKGEEAWAKVFNGDNYGECSLKQSLALKDVVAD